MWKEALLQSLIACLPVFMFMVWYAKPERNRSAHLFFAICCGITMLLNMHFSTITEHGVQFDLRHIPYLIGSLYGGVAVTAFLTVVYVTGRVTQLGGQWEYMLLASFLVLFVPILLFSIPRYASRNRKGKFKIAILLSFILVLFQFTAYCTNSDANFWGIPESHLAIWFGLCVLFAGVLLLCIHFTEIGFERIQLQVQLRDVSMKYRKEMRRLQQFIDSSPLIVVFCDNKGAITHINDLTLELVTPFSRNEILHQRFSFLLDKMEASYDFDPVEKILRGEERLTEIMKLRGRSFYTVYCLIKEMPSHGTDGVLFIGHEITELQRLKDELNRMERLSLVGQMAASITHEIRNPMAVIRGFVQLLNERSPAEQQSYFRIVLDELDRVNSIINDFLSLAQNRIVAKEPSNLNDLLNELLPLIWADANMRGQLIELKLDENMELLPMNSKEMKQLILNLSRNGMEAMTDKGVLLIETLCLQDSVQLKVVDHGVGIPPEKLEKLFEPFFTTKTNGTGLGLALCLSIVERHNGKIRVESEVGKGTSFIVSFSKPDKIA